MPLKYSSAGFLAVAFFMTGWASNALAATHFMVSGATGLYLFNQGGDAPYVSCSGCTLLAVDVSIGHVQKIGPFSDDSEAQFFAFVPWSVSYSALTNTISFIGTPDSHTFLNAKIYTIDARSGHTLHKTPWDYRDFGAPGIMIPNREFLIPNQVR